MLLNQSLKKRLERLRAEAKKPKQKRSQAEAYEQYERFEKLADQEKDVPRQGPTFLVHKNKKF